MTAFEGRPHTATGSLDYPGPSPTRRLYRAADGWLAVAARTGEEAAALLSITGTADPAGLTGLDGLVGALADAFAGRTVEDWLDVLAEYEVPACPVVERERALWDPRLAAPGDAGLTHIVRDPHIGRLRVVRTYADWAAAADAPVLDSPAPAGQQAAGGPPADSWRQHVAATLEAAGTLAEPFVPDRRQPLNGCRDLRARSRRGSAATVRQRRPGKAPDPHRRDRRTGSG